jgi:hypothetical protein
MNKRGYVYASARADMIEVCSALGGVVAHLLNLQSKVFSRQAQESAGLGAGPLRHATPSTYQPALSGNAALKFHSSPLSSFLLFRLI